MQWCIEKYVAMLYGNISYSLMNDKTNSVGAIYRYLDEV